MDGIRVEVLKDLGDLRGGAFVPPAAWSGILLVLHEEQWSLLWRESREAEVRRPA